MKKYLYINLFLIILLLSCSDKENQKKNNKSLRLLSLAPSITETICYLGKEDLLVGISNYCTYPEKLTSAKYNDMRFNGVNASLEKIISKKPSYVLTIEGQQDFKEKLRQAGIEIKTFKTMELSNVYESFRGIGKLTGQEEEAKLLIQKCRQELKQAGREVDLKGKKVLISTSSLRQDPGKINPWVAGKETYFSDIIEAMGAKNAYTGEKNYEQLSPENILSLNPDVILIVLSKEQTPAEIEQEKKVWKKLLFLKAVGDDNIFIIGKPYMAIPGPRLLKIINEFKETLKKVKAGSQQ